MKGFRKVNLRPGEKTVVEFEIDTQDLMFWDDVKHDWAFNAGDYVVSLGTSSADISFELPFKVE